MLTNKMFRDIDVLRKRFKRRFGHPEQGHPDEICSLFTTAAIQAAANPLEKVEYEIQGRNLPKQFRVIDYRVVVKCFDSTWGLLFADLSKLSGQYCRYRIEENSLCELTKFYEVNKPFKHGRYIIDINEDRSVKVYSPEELCIEVIESVE